MAKSVMCCFPALYVVRRYVGTSVSEILPSAAATVFKKAGAAYNETMASCIHWYDELDSTNDQLKRLLAQDPQLPEGTVVAARYQTAGRGRDGRSWLSEPDTNLMFSLLVRGRKSDESPATLTLAVGVGIARFLKERHKLHISLKWPNDVLIEGKKICGILCEAAVEPGGSADSPSFIVGVGLNVNMSCQQAGRIDQPATSLLLETGGRFPSEEILADVLGELTKTLASWQQQGFMALRETWLSLCGHVGQSVRFRLPGDQCVEGTFAGIEARGQALLRQTDGRVIEVLTGDLITPSGR